MSTKTPPLTLTHRATAPTIERITTCYDDTGKPFIIDADIDHFFAGSHTYKKTVYNRDGKLWVEDYGMNTLAGCQKKPRELSVFIFEIWHAHPLPKGYTVVRKKRDTPDYRINNLEKVELSKPRIA